MEGHFVIDGTLLGAAFVFTSTSKMPLSLNTTFIASPNRTTSNVTGFWHDGETCWESLGVPFHLIQSPWVIPSDATYQGIELIDGYVCEKWNFNGMTYWVSRDGGVHQILQEGQTPTLIKFDQITFTADPSAFAPPPHESCLVLPYPVMSSKAVETVLPGPFATALRMLRRSLS